MTLTVVIPCHNHGQYLGECLGSLAAQTFRDFDVIVVDDGSNVPLMAIQGWDSLPVEMEATLIWLPQCQGTAAAINAGVKIAKGEYIAIVHADDLCEPWHLDLLLTCAAPDHWCYGDLRFYVNGERGAVLRMPEWDYHKAKTKNLCHGAILFPRAAWAAVGGYPDMPDGREDWAMSLRLAHGGYPGRHVQGEPGYLYRQHGNNRSLGNHTAERRAYFAQRIREILPEVYDGSRA